MKLESQCRRKYTSHYNIGFALKMPADSLRGLTLLRGSPSCNITSKVAFAYSADEAGFAIRLWIVQQCGTLKECVLLSLNICKDL